MTDKIVVLCTCSSTDEARRVAGEIIAKRLAACVNVLPEVTSVYHWKGAVEESRETLLLIKSSRPLFDRVRAEIARLHSYEVPEIIALPVVEGSQSYLQWMDGELNGSERP